MSLYGARAVQSVTIQGKRSGQRIAGSLEELLYWPVLRLQHNTLALTDLLRSTAMLSVSMSNPDDSTGSGSYNGAPWGPGPGPGPALALSYFVPYTIRLLFFVMIRGSTTGYVRITT